MFTVGRLVRTGDDQVGWRVGQIRMKLGQIFTKLLYSPDFGDIACCDLGI